MISELIKMLPVLIGGLLAIAGGLFSQVLIHHLTEKRESNKLKTSRLESLVKSVYAQEKWIIEKQRLMVFNNQDHYDEDPITEARMIQSLYFPSLSKELVEVQEAIIELIKIISKHRVEHMTNTKNFIENYKPDEFNICFKIYLLKISNLVQSVRKLQNT